MGTITTGSFPKALWPGINTWWGDAYYNEHKPEYIYLFDKDGSEQAYEEDVEIPGFGLAPQKEETGPVTFDSHQQGPTKRYTHVEYALGYIVTKNEIQDNLYMKVAESRTRSLAFSLRQTKEIVGANVYNNAFNSSFVGGDGVELIATNHPTLAGDQSNELAVAADLSEASLEDLSIQIMRTKNARGLRISLRPTDLIIPPETVFDAERVVKSPLRSGVNFNDLNAINEKGVFENIRVNHYLTDTDAFFIKTNIPKKTGLKNYERQAIEFSQDNDFDTDNFKAKACERYSFGWTDWRGVYGSPGV